MTARQPSASSEEVRRRMERQRRRDTKPERLLRSELHRRGLRYRVDRRVVSTVRARADIVFGPAGVAVFVDGCFWHMCPKHGSLPHRNRDWWREKLEANRQRDRRVDRELRREGWAVVRVWEHEDTSAAADEIQSVVADRLT